MKFAVARASYRNTIERKNIFEYRKLMSTAWFLKQIEIPQQNVRI
jgi:hypothetical protein